MNAGESRRRDEAAVNEVLRHLNLHKVRQEISESIEGFPSVVGGDVGPSEFLQSGGERREDGGENIEGHPGYVGFSVRHDEFPEVWKRDKMRKR